MEKGIVYVVYNKKIRDEHTNELLYKIGHTKHTEVNCYKHEDAEIPGKFETLFAYKFADCKEAENIIHRTLKEYREQGEWFNLTQMELDLVKAMCEVMKGKPVTEDELIIGVDNKAENTSHHTSADNHVIAEFTKILNDDYYKKEFTIYETSGGFTFKSKKLDDEIFRVDPKGGGHKNLGRAYGYFFNKKDNSVCLLLLPKDRDEETLIKLSIVAEMSGKTLKPNQGTCETFKQQLDLSKGSLEEEIKSKLDFLLRINNEIYEKLKGYAK